MTETAIARWYVGQLQPTLLFGLLDDKKQPVDITAAALTMWIVDNVARTSHHAAGVVTVTDAAHGKFTFLPDITDVGAAGDFSLQPIATFANGPMKFQPVPWDIFNPWPSSLNVLSNDDARALIDTPLSDDQLTTVIQREESWLARQIGPLAGPRTEQFWMMPWHADSPLWLRRPTDAVTVVDGGILLGGTDTRLLALGTQVERVLGYWLGTINRPLGPVTATYSPNDTEEVTSALIDLTRLTLTETGYEMERMGDYIYNRKGDYTPSQQKRQIARSLMPHRGAKTVDMRSSVRPDRVGTRVWVSWWL